MSDNYDDIRDDDEPNSNETPTVSSGGGLGVSKKQLGLILGVVIALAVIVWWVRSSADSSSASSEIKKAKDADLGGEAAIDDKEGDDGEIKIPANPDSQLDKDEAVLAELKNRGKFGAGGSD